MEQNPLKNKEEVPEKVDNYKGHNVYIWDVIERKVVATTMPNSAGIPTAIVLRPEAYEILKSRPDLLEKIYEHELQHNLADTLFRPDLEPKHDLENNDVINFLKTHGYDFGSLKI